MPGGQHDAVPLAHQFDALAIAVDRKKERDELGLGGRRVARSNCSVQCWFFPVTVAGLRTICGRSSTTADSRKSRAASAAPGSTSAACQPRHPSLAHLLSCNGATAGLLHRLVTPHRRPPPSL